MLVQNTSRSRKSTLSVDDAGGATATGAWSAGDVSPVGTLSRGAGSDTLKIRSNARSHSKLQSLFSLVKVTTTGHGTGSKRSSVIWGSLPRRPDQT